MCGRFALGLPPAEIRMGVANHFPRLLRNPEARAARARHGEQGRQRQRQDRERRRARARGVAVRGSGEVLQQQSGEQRGDAEEEELEWPESEQDESSTTTVAPAGRASDNPEDEEDEQELAAAAARLQWENEERFRVGNYNVAPRSNGVVLRLRPRSRSQSHQAEAEEGQASDLRLRGGGEEGESVPRMKEETGKENQADGKNVWDVGDQELVIETMQWGLIPHWSKHPPSGALNTINARSEALIDNAGGMWQSLKGPKRCLVVVQGYYEWQKKSGTKIPHFTKLPPPSCSNAKPHLMLLAGLYDTVRYIDSDPSSPPIKTFTILTTTPSKSLGWLHDRMPCVLESEEDCVRWLDCRNGWTGEVAKLLRPYEGEVECYPVPPEVGKVGTNSPSFVVPVKERKDGIANFFKKQTNAEEGSSVPAFSGKVLKREHEQDDVGAEKRGGKRLRKAEEHDVVQPADDARSEKKVKTDAEAVDEKVHSPVPSNTINTSAKPQRKADNAKPTSSKADEKSQKAKKEEEEFEMQIGDDSNAPNPTSGGSAQKGKAQPRAQSEVRPTTGSKRHTRSSVGEAAGKPTTRSTRSGKQSTSVKEEIQDSDDEIQILSSPDIVSGKSKRSATSSFALGKQTLTPERKTVKRGGKQAKDIAATAAEDGAENTHQTKLDGFLKHDE